MFVSLFDTVSRFTLRGKIFSHEHLDLFPDHLSMGKNGDVLASFNRQYFGVRYPGLIGLGVRFKIEEPVVRTVYDQHGYGQVF